MAWFGDVESVKRRGERARRCWLMQRAEEGEERVVEAAKEEDGDKKKRGDVSSRCCS